MAENAGLSVIVFETVMQYKLQLCEEQIFCFKAKFFEQLSGNVNLAIIKLKYNKLTASCFPLLLKSQCHI